MSGLSLLAPAFFDPPGSEGGGGPWASQHKGRGTVWRLLAVFKKQHVEYQEPEGQFLYPQTYCVVWLYTLSQPCGLQVTHLQNGTINSYFPVKRGPETLIILEKFFKL